ncbi:hypothetical protein [Plastoroseomonas arctica]|uniref:Uncharacterized protein n=1 Tax=Plastoroseomonas arctica TaxID=1509237 RepID=A0AAF1KNI0_9PROT|nr:hypothetical protein [Plastoroseomonas arctica]MBR0654613.1 hypothetical protein [Plastoroseomonas arctica]
MLNNNNPFVFASSSAADPLSPQDALASAPGMPQSFAWSHLFVTLAEVAPTQHSLPHAAHVTQATALPAAVEEAAVPAEHTEATVVVAAAIEVAVAAPKPALVIIAEPAPLPAPSEHFIPAALPADPAFDAYARLFRNIEDRDLLADLHATLAPGSDFANAFGPPLG